MNSKITGFSSIVFALCCCQFFFIGGEVDGGVPTNEEFVLVITLDDDALNSLLTNGFLKTTIPKRMWNRVRAVRFCRPTSFLSEPFQVEDKTDKRNRTLGVFVDQSILNRLDYQPVEMRIFDANYSIVVVKLDRKTGNAADQKLDHSGTTSLMAEDSPEFFFRINENRALAGNLKNVKNLQVKTQFGKLEILFSQISAIRFAGGDSKVAFVALTDGNRFSGTIEDQAIVVSSRWGEQEFKFSELESMTSDPNASFVPDASHPAGWRLVTTVPTASHGSVRDN